MQGARCRVQGAGCRVQGVGCRVWSAGCRVQGAGCRVKQECAWRSPSSKGAMQPSRIGAAFIEREFLFDNLLVRIHFVIEMIQ